jgi:endo-1,3(4)-beta-glucanase
VRFRRRAALIAVVLAVSVSATTGCASDATGETQTSGSSDLSAKSLARLVAGVPERTVTPLPKARLAPGLIPPTNRWFSGLVYGTPSNAVFPFPMSFQLTGSGYSFGLPTITTMPDHIIGGNAPLITVNTGADSQVVSAYDTASVTISQRKAGKELGKTVIAEGSPFVSFTALSAVSLTVSASFHKSGGAWVTTIGGAQYGLVSSGVVTSTSISLQRGQYATWFAVAKGGALADFVAAAAHAVTHTSVTYSLAHGRAHTSISYSTLGSAPTLVAAMPHQYAGLASGEACSSGTYDSIYGELRLCKVSALAWSVPELTPSGSLDLTSLTSDQKERLSQQVQEDAGENVVVSPDTYGSGKAMYRLANLWKIATQVGATATAATLKAQVVSAMDQWMQPTGCKSRNTHCFVYDAQAKGLVGLAPSFGTDQFNDHHFHYGYFFYTAGLLAASDPSLATKWAPVMNLLAADVAATSPSRDFPVRRTFDAYAGHSWASGTAPFNDGNDQESSSEAVNAWNGLALWAKASNQPGLLTEATWMLSAESASALDYYTNFPLGAAVYKGYAHTVTSLIWGGKRDYSTWFSDAPNAKLAIQLVPMSPVAGYLGTSAARVKTNLAQGVPDSNYDVIYGDYLLMYSSLASPAAAAKALAETTDLDESNIDSADSRSYLLAWIMSHMK